MKAGMNEVVTKPIDRSYLKKVLAGYQATLVNKPATPTITTTGVEKEKQEGQSEPQVEAKIGGGEGEGGVPEPTATTTTNTIDTSKGESGSPKQTKSFIHHITNLWKS